MSFSSLEEVLCRQLHAGLNLCHLLMSVLVNPAALVSPITANCSDLARLH